MNFKITSLFFYFLFISQMAVSQKLVMSEPLKDAYRDLSSLRILIGQTKLNTAKLKDPENAMAYYVENYVDFFKLFIQEDKNLYKRLLPNKDTRIQKIKSSDPDSPYYLFCQAEIILQWAIIKLKFDDKINAARDVYEAYKLLEANKKRFPNFIENNKSLSIIHALAESVPSWIRKIMGIKGSIDIGTNEIKELADYALKNDNLFTEEIVAIYSYILLYSNNQKEEAYLLFDKYNLNHKTNPLVAFLKATMAQKNGQNDVALRILEERPRGVEYLPFYYLDFMYGKFKLYKLDKDANVFILKFINNFKGQHYIKEAYQKLAWYHIVINNDSKAYKLSMKKCVLKGSSLIDEDIQASREAKSLQIPDPFLLKARLLYDGGYYSQCQSLLSQKKEKYLSGKHDGEFYYRFARVNDALNNNAEAIHFYKQTISKSDHEKYYGCSAALQIGLMYEGQRNYKQAMEYFEKCTNLDPGGYSSSLHQKAKSGIDRIKKKV